jgi:allantoinase
VQHTFPLLLTEGRERGMAWPLLAGFFSERVARVFQLPASKRGIVAGADADLALVDLNKTCTIERDALLDRHRQSPYVGRKLTAKVVQTILRGRTIFKNGRIVGEPAGRLVRNSKCE